MVKKRQRAVVAMSGGVDSSVTAALLQEQGYDVVGITMNVWDHDRDSEAARTGKTCCSIKDVSDAQQVCDRLGIPFYAMNFREAFRDEVVNPFIAEYIAGRTPNPCVLCNTVLKFDLLWQKALAIEADILATGHYARIGPDTESGKIILSRGVDSGKDQSYFLFGITPEIAPFLRFPLGAMTKAETRKLANKYGFFNANKRESQDACFVADGSYADLVAADGRLPRLGKGEFVDTDGNVIGTHDGYYRYTIGQRKGIGLVSTDRLFVVDLDATQNRVIVGPRAALFQSEMTVAKINLISDEQLADGKQIRCQIRSRHKAAAATLCAIDSRALVPGGKAGVRFDAAQSAITPGQAAVFYDGERVLGGGWIEKAGPWTN